MGIVLSKQLEYVFLTTTAVVFRSLFKHTVMGILLFKQLEYMIKFTLVYKLGHSSY